MNPGWRSSYIRYKSYFLNVMARYRERADVKAYLEILLSLATISILAIFALKPTLVTISQLIKEIEAKKEALTKMNEKIQNLSRAQNLYEKEKSKILLLSSAIPEKAAPELFARQIQGLADKHKVDVPSLGIQGGVILGGQSLPRSPETSQSKENVNELKFSINVDSSLEGYIRLVNFLTDLEKLRTVNKIDSLKIATITKNNQKSLLMSINGNLPYYFKQQ